LRSSFPFYSIVFEGINPFLTAAAVFEFTALLLRAFFMQA